MENELESAAVEAVVGAAEAVVMPAVEKVDLDIKSICDEAVAGLQGILDRVKAHPDAKGLRSTLAFVIGRFEAEKEQFWGK